TVVPGEISGDAARARDYHGHTGAIARAPVRHVFPVRADQSADALGAARRARPHRGSALRFADAARCNRLAWPERRPALSQAAGGYGALVGGFEKSTFGASVLPGAAVKYFRGFAPVSFAVITAGNCLMYALYSFTAAL